MRYLILGLFLVILGSCTAEYKGHKIRYFSKETLDWEKYKIDRQEEREGILKKSIVMTFNNDIYGDVRITVPETIHKTLKDRCNLTNEELTSYLKIRLYDYAMIIKDGTIVNNIYSNLADTQSQIELEYINQKYGMKNVSYSSISTEDIHKLSSLIDDAKKEAVISIMDSVNNDPCNVIKRFDKTR